MIYLQLSEIIVHPKLSTLQWLQHLKICLKAQIPYYHPLNKWLLWVTNDKQLKVCTASQNMPSTSKPCYHPHPSVLTSAPLPVSLHTTLKSHTQSYAPIEDWAYIPLCTSCT